MTWKATVQSAPDEVPEGKYNAFISGITPMESVYGSMLKLEFTLKTDTEHNGKRVNGICSECVSKLSKLGRWIIAVTGQPLNEGEDVSEEIILNKNCQIVVGHTKKENGTIFANVVDVLPREEGTKEEEDNMPF